MGVLVVLLLLVLTAPAQAARPVTIGPGDAPGVAVDAAGTAYVAYNGPYVTPGEPLMFCAWPRGARSCAPRTITDDNASPLAQPALVGAGGAGAVWIVSARDTLQLMTSGDGGATFGAPVSLGEGRFFDAAFGPERRLALTIRNLGYIDFYERSLAGPVGGTAQVNPGYGVESQVAYAGVRPVVVSGGRSPAIAYTAWTGAGSVHDPAMWTTPRRVGKSNSFALASGRRGLWLAHEVSAGYPDRMVVRRFSGNRFGRAPRIPAYRRGLTPIAGAALAQDARGRMVAVWYSSTGERLEYSKSRTGARWSRARVLATGVETPADLQVALGPDGRGLVVWDENTGPNINAVRVSAR
jgi:hypothetical protein